MHDVVITDTSCLIVLSKLGHLEILKKLYSKIITTPEISLEYGDSLPSWIIIQEGKDKKFQTLLELTLDFGEASAISLGVEIHDCILIIDDLKGRKIAETLNLNYTGTLGVLIRAKKQGLIPSVKPLIQKLEEIQFRFSSAVQKDFLEQAGEL